MAATEIARAIVDLDGRQAGQVLSSLKKQARELRDSIKESEKAGSVSHTKKLKGELAEVTRASKAFKNATFEVNVEMNKLGAQSFSSLKKAQTAMLTQINKMKQGTREEIELYNKKIAQYKVLTAEINRQRAGMMQSESMLSRMGNTFNKYWSMATMVTASLVGLVLSFRKTVDAANSFEKKLDGLSSLTGLVGDNLKWLGQQALEMSQKQIEAGIRVTMSADDIIDAYTRMGSLRPILLQNKEALAEVTKNAIILAEAGNMELEPALEALAITMNQFNTDSNESLNIINALAAGALIGAGEIPYLSTAMQKVGTTANMMNIPINETIALLEVIAPYFSSAEEAGTSLDRVLLKLMKDNIGYKDGMFDVNLALNEMTDKFAKGESAQSIFDVRHAKTATLLSTNRKLFDQYTEAITGTNSAIEQASINTDNNMSKLEQAKNKLNVLSIELGQHLAPALTFSTNGFNYLLKAIVPSIKFLTEHGKEIKNVFKALILLTTAIYSYKLGLFLANTVMKYSTVIMSTASTIWGVMTGKIKMATVAMRIFNTTTKANPIGLAISLLTTAATAIFLFGKKTEDATEEVADFNSELEKTGELLGKDIYENLKVSGASFGDWALTATEGDLNAVQSYLTTREGEINREIANLSEDAKKKFLHHFTDAKKGVTDIMDVISRELDKFKPVPKPEEKTDTKIEKFDPKKIDSPDTSWAQYQEFKQKELEKYRADDLQSLKDQFDKEEAARKENFFNSLASLGNNLEAREALQKKFDEDELSYKVAFMNKMTANLDKILSEGGIDGLNLEEAMLSDEEKENLQIKIQDLKGSIAELQAEIALISGNAEDAEKTDIFGMTEDDWENFLGKFEKVLEYYAMFEQAIVGVNQIISNGEKKQLMQAEKSTDTKKKLLAKQLDEGAISYEEYTAKIALLDDELEQKKKKQAHDQAVREKAIALMGAIVQTALAVVKALATGPPQGYIFAAISAALGAIQIAAIATEPVPQYFTGNFQQVVGQKDKRKYNASSSDGSTGIYKQPTMITGLGLVADRGKELVFSNQDTDRIMNSPALVDAITNTINGNSGGSKNTFSTSQFSTDPAIIQMLSAMAEKISEPSIAFINPDLDYIRNHEKAVKKLQTIKKKVNV